MSQPSYFVDHKRGEVNELQALLRDPRIQRDPYKKREVIKKVIAYMTLGIDVSRLFSEMIMASNTKDHVQKKMVYLYLCSYAEQKADLAIMAINTLHKDVRDEDPMVRGLALRSLCSLRLPNITEYVLQPIRQRLNDPSAYVRRCAVVGCAKLFTRNPDAVKGSDLVDVLYNMLKDDDASVVANAVQALNEILADEGKMAINGQIINHLLDRLSDFNEWHQCAILELLARYKPEDDDEMYGIMNELEEKLRHANAAVVLAATKVFLNFTVSIPEVHHQVYERLKAPLLTLMGQSNIELAYVVVSHFRILVQRAPEVFADEFKHFFCRFNDSAPVKLLKISILESLASEKNFHDIINEFAEYVTDVDSTIARQSIKSIGAVTMKIAVAVDEAIEHLLGFLDFSANDVAAGAVIVLKDVLRKFPERYEEVIPAIQKSLNTIEEESGKLAVIWMIGEYGDTIRDAPYLLEGLIDSFEDETSTAVRCELLSATMKLFFKRPPELHKALGRLLKKAVEDTNHVDVRDRALLYYRLLKFDVHEAARVVNCPKVIVDSFMENEDDSTREKVFQEFNSLSVVYNKTADSFVTGVELDEEEEEELEQKQSAPSSSSSSAAAAPAPAQANTEEKSGGVSDLLSLDVLGFDTASAPSSTPSLQLKPQPSIDVATFQGLWGKLPVHGTASMQIKSAADAGRIEGLCASAGLATMASGTVGNVMKAYFYGQDASDGGYYLVEAICDLGTCSMTASAKSQNTSSVDDLFAVFKSAISSIAQ